MYIYVFVLPSCLAVVYEPYELCARVYACVCVRAYTQVTHKKGASEGEGVKPSLWQRTKDVVSNIGAPYALEMCLAVYYGAISGECTRRPPPHPTPPTHTQHAGEERTHARVQTRLSISACTYVHILHVLLCMCSSFCHA